MVMREQRLTYNGQRNLQPIRWHGRTLATAQVVVEQKTEPLITLRRPGETRRSGFEWRSLGGSGYLHFCRYRPSADCGRIVVVVWG